MAHYFYLLEVPEKVSRSVDTRLSREPLGEHGSGRESRVVRSREG